MKFLVVGLGNIGVKHEENRHNIGFKILDELANSSGIFFSTEKYALKTNFKSKGKLFVMIKPTTYMNLSGKAVNYWLQKEMISLENTIIITDDIALPFGKIRIRKKGSDGGHNGLKNISQILNTTEYIRLKFGVGNNFYSGNQVNYVLGNWDNEEKKKLNIKIKKCSQAILSFGFIGIERTMNLYNNK